MNNTQIQADSQSKVLTDEMQSFLARYAQSLIPNLIPEYSSPPPWESTISKRYIHSKHSTLDDIDDLHMKLVTY